jgi:hypothetical protein
LSAGSFNKYTNKSWKSYTKSIKNKPKKLRRFTSKIAIKEAMLELDGNHPQAFGRLELQKLESF